MSHSGKSCKLKIISCSVHTFTVNQKAGEKMFQANKIYIFNYANEKSRNRTPTLHVLLLGNTNECFGASQSNFWEGKQKKMFSSFNIFVK